MDPTRHERLTAIFLEAGGLPAAERAAFLERVCAGEPDLRREVEILLLADASAGSHATERLASPVQSAAATVGLSEAETATLGPPRIAHFRILRRLGAGGAGAVFEAQDERMNRRVALKVLSSTLALSERAARRFEREAWIAGRLSHPNVVRVYERGSWEGYQYYSMELAQGGSLRGVIENMRRAGRDERLGLDYADAEYVHWAVRQTILAARVLHIAHREGVVHRDVKPENLLLDGRPPEIRLADFGIAMEAEAARLTSEGQAVGTVCYMAPEQLLQRRDEINGRADQYALGVTLFELLTLEYPFRGDTHQRYINAVLADEARRPRAINGRVSRDLEVVIRKSLEKDPRHRYATMEPFAEDLESVLHLRPIRARPPGAIERAVKWIRRKPLHAAVIGLLAVALPAFGLAGYRMTMQARLLREASVRENETLVNQAAMNQDDRLMMELAGRILSSDESNPLASRTMVWGHLNLSESAASPAEADSHRRSALAYADRLIAAWPRVPGYHGLKADILRRLDRHAEAESEDRLAAELPEAEDEDSLYYMGVEALHAGDPERAESLFSRLMAIRRRPEALLWRAKARLLQGRRDEAIADYSSVVDLRPLDPFPHHELGRLYTNAGRFTEARLHLERAERLAPGSPLVHEIFADYALAHGRRLLADGARDEALARFQEAEEHSSRCLDLDPDRPYSHINMGASIVERARASDTWERERMELALRHFLEAKAVSGRHGADRAGEIVSMAQINTCDLLIQIGDAGRAIPSCREVATLHPDVATAHYNLAGAYALDGRREEALAELERNVELGDIDHAYLRADPWFARLRDDPRFLRLLSRMEVSAGGAER